MVLDVLGSDGLRRALAHPENLPDASEFADPGSWLARAADDVDIPDDVASLLEGLGNAPREGSAEERTHPAGPDERHEPGGADDGPRA